MSLFHIAIAGNIVSIMDATSGYTIERPIKELPQDVLDELCRKIFYTTNLGKAHWTKAGTNLGLGSAVKHYFLFEKAEEKRNMEQEYEEVMAMQRYASCIVDTRETVY